MRSPSQPDRPEGILEGVSVEEAQAHWSAIVESSDDAIISKSLSGVILSWNKGAERIYGYSAEEVIGQDIGLIAPSERQHEIREIIDKIRHGDRVSNFETVRVRKDGRRVHISLTVSPILGPKGTVVGASAIGRDISTTKRAERALAASEARLKAIIGSAMDSIITIDTEQRITLFNSAAERMFGVPAAEMLGKPLERLIADSSFGELQRQLADFDTHDPGNGLAPQLNLEALRADGTEFPIEVTVSPIAMENDQYFTIIMRDVTERKRAEQELRETDRLKDEFLAMLAHELRNPLGAIASAVYALSVGGASESLVEWSRSIIDRQVHHLTRLVDDLLDMSKIPQGKLTLERNPFDLAAAVALAIETTRSSITRKQKISVSLSPQPIVVEGDLSRIAQVIGNLINNAAKFSDDGGEIALTVERDNGHAFIRVRDWGMGIPSNMLSRVFEPFVQCAERPDHAMGGVGIGLTLVRRIVEMHNGTVAAFSDGLGRGSEFIVRLPTYQPILDQQREPHQLPTEGVRSRRILVVEDNADAAQALEMVFHIARHNVRAAHDGAQALEIAKRFLPEIVFLDIGLPGMDGYQIARKLREIPELERTLLVAMTGYGQDDDRRRTTEAGFDRHLVKPVSPEVVLGLTNSIEG